MTFEILFVMLFGTLILVLAVTGLVTWWAESKARERLRDRDELHRRDRQLQRITQDSMRRMLAELRHPGDQYRD